MKLTIDLPDNWTMTALEPLKSFLLSIGYRVAIDQHGDLIARMAQPPVNSASARTWPPKQIGAKQ